MYQEFRITAIEPSIKTKTINVTTTFYIDPSTVSSSTIQLYEKSTRNNMDLDFEVKGKEIIIKLLKWPEPNIEYVISINQLKTVLDEPLISGTRRKIIFESSIVSRLNITYPAYHEVINDLKIEWEETMPADNQNLVGFYYIEIAKENAFYNILRDFEISNRTSIDIYDIPIGQYYVRGRVQKDGEYGLWSDIVTFTIDTESKSPDPIFDENGDGIADSIYIPDIEVVAQPQNGTTPKSFIVEFDCPIDPATLQNIVVIRRTI